MKNIFMSLQQTNTRIMEIDNGIEKVATKEFTVDGLTFYCNSCVSYTSDFTPSCIERKYRKCRSCSKKQSDDRKANVDQMVTNERQVAVTSLVASLKEQFAIHNTPYFVNVNENFVTGLLMFNKVFDPRNVANITIPENDPFDLVSYTFELITPQIDPGIARLYRKLYRVLRRRDENEVARGLLHEHIRKILVLNRVPNAELVECIVVPTKCDFTNLTNFTVKMLF